jgi:hypothetical protein
MDRKKIILIVAAVLVLIGILALLLRPKRAPETTESSPVGALTAAPSGALARSGGLTNVAPVNEPVLPPPPPPTETAVRQVAMTFAERYGSFSNEGNFVNISDLFPLMTERYQRAQEAELARLRQQPRPAEFSSTTTIVMKADVDLPSGEASKSAIARVLTQRTEVRSGATPKTYGQTLTVQLVKISDGWRVDGATWEPAKADSR